MHSLQSLHTFALPANAADIVEVTAEEQVLQCDFSTPFIILGEGSNTLFIEDYAGTVILMKNKGVEYHEDDNFHYLSVAAGENWHGLVCYCLKNGIYGLENLALIPGTVGASPVQNIGAYGVEIEKFIGSVTGFDLNMQKIVSLSSTQCQFAYRDSIFKHALKNKFIITTVKFKLPKQWQPVVNYGPLQHLKLTGLSDLDANSIFNAVIKIRSEKLPDPKIIANAGSFFKNPLISQQALKRILASYPDVPHYSANDGKFKVAAGWLIEQAQLKGFKIAGVEVNPTQALVLLNHGNSQGADVVTMVKKIQSIILQKFNLHLEHEVRLVGQAGELYINHQQSGLNGVRL